MNDWYECHPFHWWLMQHGPFEYAISAMIVAGIVFVGIGLAFDLFCEHKCPHCGMKQ